MSKCKASDIIKIMSGWVGLSRSKGTHKVIIDTYNNYKPLARNYRVSYKDAYCDTTVSAAFIKADAVDMLGGTECSVEKHIAIFKEKGIWIEDGTVNPKVGYVICYNWDETVQPNDGHADHIGVVETVDEAKREMVVLEGNIKGDVGRRTIGFANGYIRGYANPDYLPEEVTVVNDTVQPLSGKESYAFGEEVEVTAYIQNGSNTPVNGKLKVTAVNSLRVRKAPDFTIRDTWYKTADGYISAYKVEGWVEDSKGWWYEKNNHEYVKFGAAMINDHEYHFDKDGYMITASRIAETGEVIY